MSKVDFEQDMHIVKQEWDSFIFSLRRNAKMLRNDLRETVIAIKRLERLEKIVQHAQNDNSFLIEHKNSILELDNSLNQKFLILEAFAKRNNLNNPVAKRTSNEILASQVIKSKLDRIEALKSKRDSLDAELERVENLVRGNAFDKDTIVKYMNMYDFSPKAKIAIQLYPIYKSARKSTLSTDLKIENPMFKDKYVELDKKFKDMLLENNELITKYNAILSSLSDDEKTYYKLFKRDITDEKGKMIVTALEVMNYKSAIEKYSRVVVSTNYTHKNNIELLEELINDFGSLIESLQKVETKENNQKVSIENFKESKTYFMLDREGNAMLPEEIKTKENLMNLIELTGKLQEDPDSINRKHAKINRSIEEDLDKKVLIAETSNMKTSYIELNSKNGSKNEGILILSAALNDENLRNYTDSVVKSNKRNIAWQITTLERKDVLQLGLQEYAKDQILDILRSETHNEGSGLNNEKKR